MKLLIIILSLILLRAGNGFAQNNSEVFPEQVSIDHNEAVQSHSRDYVLMISVPEPSRHPAYNGMGHIAAISQTGSENITKLNQTGFSHFAEIILTGDLNEIWSDQRGKYNQLYINLTGDHNRITSFQEGEQNSIWLQETASGTHWNFEQLGNHHEIEIIGSGIPMNIRQTGYGESFMVNGR